MSKEQYVNGMTDITAVTVFQYGEDLKWMNFSGR